MDQRKSIGADLDARRGDPAMTWWHRRRRRIIARTLKRPAPVFVIDPAEIPEIMDTDSEPRPRVGVPPTASF